jgi:hypothetical protein
LLRDDRFSGRDGENGMAAAAFSAGRQEPDRYQGPFFGDPVIPYVFDGDLRTLTSAEPQPELSILPLKYVPGTEPKGAFGYDCRLVDPVAQTAEGGADAAPIANFAGMSFADTLAGWPPDTNGDGPNHYIQTVNTLHRNL